MCFSERLCILTVVVFDMTEDVLLEMLAEKCVFECMSVVREVPHFGCGISVSFVKLTPVCVCV